MVYRRHTFAVLPGTTGSLTTTFEDSLICYWVFLVLVVVLFFVGKSSMESTLQHTVFAASQP
jgi:hypothetical protein